MEINVGLIRDRQGIYAGLLQSQAANRQLAVCYKSNDKLIVKISIVKELVSADAGTTVVLLSPDKTDSETTIRLEDIESIYLISDFMK